MNGIGKFFWGLRCEYYRAKVMYYVIKGDRKKANKNFNKVLDMLEAYVDIYVKDFKP